MNEKKITIEKIINAPREDVWRAWIEPELVKKWWGPEGFSAPSIKIELKVGGKYIFAMHGPKGSEWDKDMYSAGTFKEIVPNEKLVITDYFSDENGQIMAPAAYGMDANFPRESTVIVLFEEIERGKTKLSILYLQPESKEQVDAMRKSGMKEGWNSSLNKLKNILESK